MLCVHAHSGQAGDLGVGSVTYDGQAPTASQVLNSSGAVREVYYVALWDDSDLPSTAGSYTVSFTVSNHGATPGTSYWVQEITSVDQTSVPVSGFSTNTNFGTTGQSISVADEAFALIAAQSGGFGSNPSFSWSDSELVELNSGSTRANGMAVGHAQDGGLTGTCSAAETGDGWIAWSLKEDAGGLTDYTIEPEAGGYSQSGTAVNLLKDSALNAEQGEYLYTGQESGLIKSFIIASESGSYSLAGTEANLLRASNLLAETDAYLITGQNVTLTKSGDISLICESGVYTISGQEVNLTLALPSTTTSAKGNRASAFSSDNRAFKIESVSRSASFKSNNRKVLF